MMGTADPWTPRAEPAISTHNQNNHTVRSEHWRYVRYADGSEELYDHRTDPNEWTNLATNPKHADVIREHAQWLLDHVRVAPSPRALAIGQDRKNEKQMFERVDGSRKVQVDVRVMSSTTKDLRQLIERSLARAAAEAGVVHRPDLYGPAVPPAGVEQVPLGHDVDADGAGKFVDAAADVQYGARGSAVAAYQFFNEQAAVARGGVVDEKIVPGGMRFADLRGRRHDGGGQPEHAAREVDGAAGVATGGWEAETYDDKWSISFDERCISYAKEKFTKVAPDRKYGKVLEIGCGTGFFIVNLLAFWAALEKVLLWLEPDGYTPSLYSFGPVLDALDFRLLKWPGHGTDPNATFQYLDKELMPASEYGDYLQDPTGYYLRRYLPRVAGAFEGLALPYARLAPWTGRWSWSSGAA